MEEKRLILNNDKPDLKLFIQIHLESLANTESEKLYSERNVTHSQLFSQLCMHDAWHIHVINGNSLVIYLLSICFD